MKSNDWIIEVRNLTRIYPVEDDPVVALDDITLNIRKGEICCIFGQSGSGKSTLLNQLAGLEKPTRGGIRIDGTILNRLDESRLALFRQKHTGFVFQSYNLIGSLNALENVAMPLMFQGVDVKTRERKAAALLKKVGLGSRMRHYPRQMSGGQQQRVGIARALVTRPAVLFADEPTGNLDTRSTKEILDMIHAFAREYQLSVVLVSHDPQAAAYADHIVTLSDGKIIKEEWKEPVL